MRPIALSGRIAADRVAPQESFENNLRERIDNNRAERRAHLQTNDWNQICRIGVTFLRRAAVE